MRTAITYHYSLAFGGSERVLEELAKMYPEADFFALMVEPDFLPESLKGRKITTSFLDRIPRKRRLYQHLLPLYPLAVECLDLSGYDLVISSDGASTKGVLTEQDTVHLCYCHSPARSYWDQYGPFRKKMSWAARSVFTPVSQYLRLWDFAAAQRIDGFIANSAYVADRIRKYYRRESTVIYPPVDLSGAYLADRQGDFYLSVGRLVASKRIDVLIEACNRLGRKLRIAGTGPEEKALRAISGPTIEFLGRIDDTDLREMYAHCRALLFAADEDFGLVAVEAQAFGRPVVAYGRGGSLESVRGFWPTELRSVAKDVDVSAYSGIFFQEQTATSLAEALWCFETIEEQFDPQWIQSHVRRFDTAVFVSEMRHYVEERMASRFHPLAYEACSRSPDSSRQLAIAVGGA